MQQAVAVPLDFGLSSNKINGSSICRHQMRHWPRLAAFATHVPQGIEKPVKSPIATIRQPILHVAIEKFAHDVRDFARALGAPHQPEVTDRALQHVVAFGICSVFL